MELIALPIKIKDSLPAQKILEGENIFCYDGVPGYAPGYPSVKCVSTEFDAH